MKTHQSVKLEVVIYEIESPTSIVPTFPQNERNGTVQTDSYSYSSWCTAVQACHRSRLQSFVRISVKSNKVKNRYTLQSIHT